MASIIIPRKWQTQPQYAVELNSSNPLAIGITSFVLPTRVLAYPRNELLTPVGTGSIGAGISGLAVKTIAGSHGIQCAVDGDSMLVGCDNQVTIATYFRYQDTTARASSLFGFTTTNRVQVHAPYSDGNVYWDYGGTGNRRLTAAYGAKTTNPESLVFQYSNGVESAAYKSVWRNRVLLGNSATVDTNPRLATTDPFYVGSAYGQAGDNSEVYLLIVANRIWNSGEVAAFAENPWQIFRKRPQILYFDVGGITGVTGTLAATESGSDTAALTGDVLIDGALSATESGSDSASFAGDVLIDGALAATETGSDTAAFTGDASNAIIGTLAATETGADSADIAGDVFVKGALSVSEAGSDSAAIAGDVYVSGTLAATETGNDAAAFVGSAAGPITGTLDATETGEDVASFRGPITVTGGGIGHGGFARKAKRLVRIEEAESPEEVIAEIERQFAETPRKVGRKPKTVTTAQKPLETPEVAPNQWLDYYQSQAQALREQEAMNDLLAQANLRLQALQEQETLKRLEEYQAMLQVQQEEEEMLLLLMAA